MRKIYFGGAVLLLLAAWLLLSPDMAEEKALLAGQASWVIEKGAEVEPGSELVRVRTLTGGEIAAARAKDRGIVRETCVQAGDKLAKGTIVVKIEKKTK